MASLDKLQTQLSIFAECLRSSSNLRNFFESFLLNLFLSNTMASKGANNYSFAYFLVRSLTTHFSVLFLFSCCFVFFVAVANDNSNTHIIYTVSLESASIYITICSSFQMELCLFHPLDSIYVSMSLLLDFVIVIPITLIDKNSRCLCVCDDIFGNFAGNYLWKPIPALLSAHQIEINKWFGVEK